jgi:hypothetical protein
VLTSTQALVLSRPTLFLRDATTLFDEGRNIVHNSASRQLREFLVAFDRWIRLVSPDPCVPKERQ